jgi:hypothetical protein
MGPCCGTCQITKNAHTYQLSKHVETQQRKRKRTRDTRGFATLAQQTTNDLRHGTMPIISAMQRNSIIRD